MELVICVVCQLSFETFACHVRAGGNKGTKCPNCRPNRDSRKKQVKVVCAECNKDLSVKQCIYDNNAEKRFYCNSVCFGAWRSKNVIGEKHHSYKVKIDVICALCGKIKSIHESYAKAYDLHFCCNEHRYEWNRGRTRGDNRITIPCAGPGCAKTKKDWQSQVKYYKRSFCSKNCKALWYKECCSGDQNPSWKGGRDISCEVCGNPVWTAPSKQDGLPVFCSIKCWRTSVAVMGIAGSLRKQDAQIPRRCNACGKHFLVGRAESARRRSLYCSRKCYYPSRVKYKTEIQKRMRRLHSNIGSMIWKALRRKKAGVGWQRLVNYTLMDLRKHLESSFQDGMCWENYGKWHVDHIRPRSSFTFDDPTDPQFLECWGLHNLQPLWAIDNIKKGAKYTPAPTTATPILSST